MCRVGLPCQVPPEYLSVPREQVRPPVKVEKVVPTSLLALSGTERVGREGLRRLPEVRDLCGLCVQCRRDGSGRTTK